jgi:hypothetical protein
MMRLLQNIKPSSALWVVIFAFILRTPYAFVQQGAATFCDTPFFPGFFLWAQQNPVWDNVLATVLVCTSAMLLNRVCINQDVIYTHTYLPAWFFVLVSSLIPAQMHVHPLLFSNILILIGFNFLFSLFLYEGPSVLIYLTALFFGAAAMFQLQLLALFIFILGAVILMKRITLKDLLAAFLGLLMPIYVLLSVWYMLNSNKVAVYTFVGNRHVATNAELLALWPYALCFILVILSFFKVFANFFKNNIRTRRINQVLIFYFTYMLLYQFFSGVCSALVDICLLFIPSAVFIAYLLVGTKYRRLKAIANMLLVITAIFSLYGSYLGSLRP